MERAEEQQTSVAGGKVGTGVEYNGGFENPSVSSHSQSRVVLVNVPQVCHTTFHSMPVSADIHGRFLFSPQPPFPVNHLPHSQLGTPLLSTLHSTPSDGLPPSSGAFTFPYYVSPMSMQPNQPWPFQNQEEQ